MSHWTGPTSAECLKKYAAHTSKDFSQVPVRALDAYVKFAEHLWGRYVLVKGIEDREEKENK